MSRRLLLPLAALLLAALVWFLWPSHNEADPSLEPAAPAQPLARPPAQVAVPAPRDRATTAPLEISDLAKDLNAPAGDLPADLRILQACLENFRSNFPRDGNPVGTNAEITAALTGRNKLRYAVIPPNHPAINRDGELCDRWGTPFFFHAESGTRMTIRSAGPDKKLHTPDDVELTP
ncbi:MAG: hypothetical protein HZA93_07690 [Verrucomicrobia bacterium]|nr:hypothetical protein [Verrucomicrobiota bacterium]